MPALSPQKMNRIKITAIRQTVYPDLMAQYENPIEHACEVREGQEWISVDGKQPEGLCDEAWKSMQRFVEALARGEGMLTETKGKKKVEKDV